MRLKVFKPTEPKELEEPVYLALEQGDHGVLVTVVNEFGAPIPGGDLLEFTHDGTIARPIWVAEGLGFKLDKVGRIKLSDPSA